VADADPAGPSGTIARPRGELALRVCSALVLVPLAIGTAYLGGWPFAIFWSLAAIGVLWEWSSLVGGAQRRLLVTGTALSPEYIFAGMWGMPDVRAFGVFWLDADELAAALDMQGAFNRVAIKLAPGTSQPATVDAVSRQLAAFGGLPANGRDEQMSHAMLDNEIREQQVLGTVLPSIFLAVAAFLEDAIRIPDQPPHFLQLVGGDTPGGQFSGQTLELDLDLEGASYLVDVDG